MKYFNTAGPCDPKVHYMLPPEPRLPDARPLIDRAQYFVVHAPRQTGKTTTLTALATRLTAEAHYVVVYVSCEESEPAGDNYAAAEESLLDALRSETQHLGLAPELLPPDPWPAAPAGRQLSSGLSAWAEQCPRPLVLFFDEIDALQGESLRSVLRQLRAGYRRRPDAFPASVVLCGLRDVRDYKAASGGDASRLGTASPFNIKVTSLRLGDFSEADVRDLYGQHTAETGQVFTEEALQRAWAYTQGQPWLTNALANEITFEMRIKAPEPISAKHLDEAKERLILERATHLDSLVDKLNEPRVHRVIEPLIAGGVVPTGETYNDDVAYVRDLGLIAPGNPLAVANPIYREVIVRVLGAATEGAIAADPRSFVQEDGRLNFAMVLREFSEFWQLNGEILATRNNYHEAACQLVFMAYLQRVVNDGGQIEREYEVGKRRIDMLVRWPYQDSDGKRAVQQEAIELKVWADKQKDPLDQGLQQLDAYLTRLGLDHGTLVIFDRRPTAPPIPERTPELTYQQSPTGRPVTLLRA